MRLGLKLFQLLEKLMKRLSTKASYGGLWIGAFSLDKTRELTLIEKVVEALQFIKTYDPLRYRRILSDLHGIWIIRIPGSIGMFQPTTNICQVDASFVLNNGPETIASVVVHEATHARLKRLGYEEAARHRIEGVCRRREAAFARRHPVGDVMERFSLDRPTSPDFYSDSARAFRHREGAAQILREIGVPSWMIRSLVRLRDLRDRVEMWRKQLLTAGRKWSGHAQL